MASIYFAASLPNVFSVSLCEAKGRVFVRDSMYFMHEIQQSETMNRCTDTVPRLSDHCVCASGGNGYSTVPESTGGLFRLHVIASGSKGNAAILETPATCLLIDCGISKKQFMAGCDHVGFDPGRISSVIVTHEHSDHTKGLGATLRGLRKLGALPTIYATRGTFDSSSEMRKICDDFPIEFIAHSQSLSLGAINVQFVPTSHDAADPVCMVFETSDGVRRDVLGYVTDTGIFPDGLGGLLGKVRILALESNHDEQMLASGPYPGSLKRRVGGDQGHLSNGQSDTALEMLLSTSLETVIGMHLSETNNLPSLARSGFERVIERNAHPAQAYTGYQSMPISIG